MPVTIQILYTHVYTLLLHFYIHIPHPSLHTHFIHIHSEPHWWLPSYTLTPSWRSPLAALSPSAAGQGACQPPTGPWKTSPSCGWAQCTQTGAASQGNAAHSHTTELPTGNQVDGQRRWLHGGGKEFKELSNWSIIHCTNMYSCS